MPNNSSSQPPKLCPFCGDPNVKATPTGNNGGLYVAEEFDECTEVFDGDIRYYKCPKGHSFYAS